MDDDLWKNFIKPIKPLQKGKGRVLPPGMNPFISIAKDKAHRGLDAATVVQKEILRPISVVLQEKVLQTERQETWAKQAVQHLNVKEYKKKSVEARIDLHGYTVSTAEMALKQFFARAQSQGLKFVLVITGKGKPETGSIIRNATLDWFAAHTEFVVGYTEALPKDGGAGAFYVHVRKLRVH